MPATRTVWEPSCATICTGILAAATLVIAPWLLRGYTAGHDTPFHINWWLEFSKHFQDGSFHPKWAELAYRGYGEPAFIFYPPLSLYLGGALTSLLPFRLVLGAYVWLVMALAGFSFYHLCREFFDARAALLGAVVYVLNPYHLLEVHARCSMAELLVSAVLPLLLLVLYRLDGARRRGMAVAAVLFALVALSNIPLTVVTGYSAFAFVIALTRARRSGVAPLMRLVAAGALGAGLAAFLLLPAWYEKRWVLASVHAVAPPEAHLVRLGALGSHWEWALAGVEVGLIVLGIAAWALCRRMRPRDAYWAFTALFLTSMVMVLPVSAVIWHFAPALVYVQFPFRWLGVMGLAMCFFAAAAAQQSAKGLVFAGGVAALAMVTLAAFSALINTRADVMLPSLKRQFAEGRGYLGWPFVLPRDVKVDESGIPLHLTAGEPLVTEVSLQDASQVGPGQAASRNVVTRWTAEAREVEVEATQPVGIRFRLFRYPGWSAYLDGKPGEMRSDAREAIVVQAPAGHSRVTLRYEETADQMWGTVVSAFSAVVLLWMVCRKGASEALFQ
jgi:uncharacterized membrane protein